MPVLLEEVLQYLNPQPGQNFVDATLGGGGYSVALLDKVGSNGRVLSMDLDSTATGNHEARMRKQGYLNNLVVQGNFKDIAEIAVKHEFANISGIVADIGLSSYQIDESGRGISFQKKEPLDMRFDTSSNGRDAKFIVNESSPEELFKIFKDFGEEKFASQIVKAIIRKRQEIPVHYTTDLVEVIQNALPKPVKHKYVDSCRRVFQALRIAVNHELENLEAFLPRALDILDPGGSLVVVSFHSLEDRMVKQFFVEASRGCVCPSDFPQCVCGRTPAAHILTKKPITAGVEELERNPRSKSAKLRGIQKN